MINAKYDEMLIGFADLLKEKNAEIWWKDCEISTLKKQLEYAESRIEEVKELKKVGD